MTDPKSPRIDLSPGRTQRLDFDSFAHMNLPGKRQRRHRLAFKLIWIAHQIYPTVYNRLGLRTEHYISLKTDIEDELSKEQGQKVQLIIPRAVIEKTMRYMRKAGYLRYKPLEDLWYFSSKASGTLRKLASMIDEDFQVVAMDKRKAGKIIHDFKWDLKTEQGDTKKSK
jgi:hypothetical protein